MPSSDTSGPADAAAADVIGATARPTPATPPPPATPPMLTTRPRRAAAGAVATTVASVLPVFLFSGLAVQIARDLHFSPAGQGLAVACYFGFSAICSVPAGAVVERYGSTWVSRAAILTSAVLLITLPVLARSYLALLVLLVLAGTANALGQLAANLSLAHFIPLHRQGLSFGLKQAAIPIATLLAGVSVPVIALTLGWQWAFVLAGLLALAALPLVPPAEPGGHRAGTRDHDRATGALVVIAVACGLGSAGGSALSAFVVRSAADGGIAPGLAGLTLSLGSVVSIVVRIGGGALADRRRGGHLAVVAGMLGGGAAGLALLADQQVWTLLAGTIVGFGLGWSWPGVLNFAVVRLNPSAPAAATSITQSGVYAGGSLGPLCFGALVAATSYPTGWLAAGVAMALAAVLMGVGAVLMSRHPASRSARPTQPVCST